MKILITTLHDLDPERSVGFGHWYGPANEALRRGLARRQIAWQAVRPGRHTPSLDGIDAVLAWWGQGRRIAYRMVQHSAHPIYGPVSRAPVPRLRFERRLERACRSRGIPMINAYARRAGLTHGRGLRAWKAAGIQCPPCQPFVTLEDLTLGFPAILRVDGGRFFPWMSALANDREGARRLLDERAGTGRKRYDLAVRFVDTRYPDGRYRKRRAWVIGDRVIPRQEIVSEHWNVKVARAATDDDAIAVDRAFRREGEVEADLVRRAASLLGTDIVALDYTRAADGGYWFWEGNPQFGIVGLGDEPMSEQFRAATGRDRADIDTDLDRLGDALGHLVATRVAG